MKLIPVRERIRQSFLSIHNEQRDREQVKADVEMMAVIQPETTAETKPGEETVEVVAPHIAKHAVRRTNVHGAYVIEEVRESAEELIQQALRSLG